MTRRVRLTAVLIACLGALPLTASQDKDAPRMTPDQAARTADEFFRRLTSRDPALVRENTELATRVAARVERAVRSKEPEWSLKKGVSLGPVHTQRWESGRRELEVEVYVRDSPEQASLELDARGVLPVAISQKLEDFGEEARHISHPYVTWVGVRKGRLMASVWGPGGELSLTKRCALYALEQLEDQ